MMEVMKVGYDGENKYSMRVYIASSWRNEHAVRMLTERLRAEGLTVLSFIENAGSEEHNVRSKKMDFDEWVWGEQGREKFEYDTSAAATCPVTVYISPSGTDAWTEVGIAWGAGNIVLGLWAKGEPGGLMRRIIHWFDNHAELIAALKEIRDARGESLDEGDSLRARRK